MGLFAKIFGKSAASEDAEALYHLLLAQSRQPEFFGHGRVPDSYDGRIDILTLHMTIMNRVLRQHERNGEALSQALFDAMKDDFDIALREEGLTDGGVRRRIKPMISLFYTRMKAYDAALAGETVTAYETDALETVDADFRSALEKYAQTLYAELKELSLGSLAKGKFSFPKL